MIEAAVVYESQSCHPRNLKSFCGFLFAARTKTTKEMMEDQDHLD
jgi:hypothetical protein